jgi:hypothetical protein
VRSWLFNTDVVGDFGQVGEPVDVMLMMQLDGGIDITRAFKYC